MDSRFANGIADNKGLSRGFTGDTPVPIVNRPTDGLCIVIWISVFIYVQIQVTKKYSKAMCCCSHCFSASASQCYGHLPNADLPGLSLAFGEQPLSAVALSSPQSQCPAPQSYGHLRIGTLALFLSSWHNQFGEFKCAFDINLISFDICLVTKTKKYFHSSEPVFW